MISTIKLVFSLTLPRDRTNKQRKHVGSIGFCDYIDHTRVKFWLVFVDSHSKVKYPPNHGSLLLIDFKLFNFGGFTFLMEYFSFKTGLYVVYEIVDFLIYDHDKVS